MLFDDAGFKWSLVRNFMVGVVLNVVLLLHPQVKKKISTITSMQSGTIWNVCLLSAFYIYNI